MRKSFPKRAKRKGLKTKFRITELKVGRYHVELVIAVVSQDQIPYNGIERKLWLAKSFSQSSRLKTKFRITELKAREYPQKTTKAGIVSQDQIPYNGIESRDLHRHPSFLRTVSRPNSI